MREREEARAAKDFERADEIRDELAELGWAVRDSADGPVARAQGLASPAWPTRSSTGSNPVAEAERGRRRVHRVWRAPETAPAELERLCGSPDHQGVVAEVDPYPYGDPVGMLRGEARCSSRSTRCRTRATSAPSAARPSSPAPPGWSIPERRSAAVTAVACKASAGAVEHLEVAHVRNLADWLAEAKEAGFWIWGADAEAEAGALGGRPHRPDGARPRRRGQGPAAAGRRRLRRPRRPAAPRRGRLAQRLRRRHRAALRGPPPALLRPKLPFSHITDGNLANRIAPPQSRATFGPTASAPGEPLHMQRRLQKSQFGVDRTPRARKLAPQQG